MKSLHVCPMITEKNDLILLGFEIGNKLQIVYLGLGINQHLLDGISISDGKYNTILR